MLKNLFGKNGKDLSNENENENYSINGAAGKSRLYKRAVICIAVCVLLIFGAGMKYARYVDGKPLGDIAVAGNIVSTSGFDNPVASTDIVVKTEGCVDESGYFSVSGNTSLREIINFVGVPADGDIGDFDFNHKPQTGDIYYVKNKNNPVDITPWLNNEYTADYDVTGEVSAGGGSADNVSADKININTATSEELKKLDGIGDTKAQAIIDYREKNGGFNRIEDIMAVKGIGNKTYENLKTYITVE